MENPIKIANKHCANWDKGKCLGVIMVHKDNILVQYIDKKLASKNCFAGDDCDYYNNVVIPGLIKKKGSK